MCFLLCISPKAIKALNLILTIILSVSIIVALAIILIKSKYTSLSFEWTPILIATILIFFLSALVLTLNILATCYNSKVFYFVFFIISIAILILSAFFAIFCLVNASTKAVLDRYGCETNDDDLKETYDNYDSYLSEVDIILCSKDCVCSLYNKNLFTQEQIYRESKSSSDYEANGDYSIDKSLSIWVYENNSINPISFTNCTDQAQDKARNEFLDNTTSDMNKDDIKDFESWYSLLEGFFNCVGICETKYRDDGENRRINKYLFTDINRGVPEYYGCVYSLAEWVPDKLLAFGLASVGVFLIEIFIIWMTCTILFKQEEEEKGFFNCC